MYTNVYLLLRPFLPADNMKYPCKFVVIYDFMYGNDSDQKAESDKNFSASEDLFSSNDLLVFNCVLCGWYHRQ